MPSAASVGERPPEIVTLLNYVATDDRPTLVLKLPLKSRLLEYRNNALSRFLTVTASESSFTSWVERLPLSDGAVRNAGHKIRTQPFGGRDWSLSFLGSSYVAVSSVPTEQFDHGSESSNGRQSRNSSASSPISNDENYLLRIPQLMGDPYVEFFTHHAWHETGLGALRDWHPVLREFVASALVCPSPRVLYWGADSCQVYNEAAVQIIGAKHPFCLGRPLAMVWGQDIANQVSKTFSLNSRDLKGMPITNVEHIMDRDGYTEEAFFTYTPLPLCDSDGTVLGNKIELSETTASVLLEERTAIRHSAVEYAESMTGPLDVWQQFSNVLQPDEVKDICYAMFFGVVESVRTSPQASDTTKPDQRYQLNQSFGFLDQETTRQVPRLLASTLKHDPSNHKKITVLQQKAGDCPQALAVSVPDRGVVNTVCVFHIDNNNGHPLGFVVLGMNPRRRFNDDTRQFVQSLRDIFARRTALLSRPDEEREDDMVHMYRDAPIGLFKFRPDGHPIFLNDHWLDIFGLKRADFHGPAGNNFAWADAMYEDDRETGMSAWEHSTISGGGTWEFRTKIHGPNRWFEVRTFSELDENGKCISVYGWLSEISHRKLTETLMSDRLSDALATKNAAIQFIDIVSHEMRNPLSSILQLADSILATIKPLAEDIPFHAANSIIDAADTINLCAQHQKSIVDDILTLSKLDSKLVVLSPDIVQIRQVVKKVMRMVEVDLVRSQIETSVRFDPSCTELGVDHVSLDSGRLLQILLNLLTNAIKFTQHQLKTRRICLTLSASKTRPDGKAVSVRYIEPRNAGNNDATSDQSLTNTEGVYLEFSVSDTGLGMTEEETTHLFYRFSQASPKTYKQYGGSGLGLFICRELAELHGGQIGFNSEYGTGTNFMFYIKAKHANPPELPMDLDLESTQEATAEPSTVSIKDLHVLIVEDNAINQRVMAQQLRRTGCSVDVADNGEEALEFLSSTVALLDAPDALPLSIILMDIEMPIMDGLTCTRKIREMEAAGEIRKHLPITGITANSRQEQIDMAQDAGMDDVVTKPFRISDIVPRIEALATKWPFPV